MYGGAQSQQGYGPSRMQQLWSGYGGLATRVATGGAQALALMISNWLAVFMGFIVGGIGLSVGGLGNDPSDAGVTWTYWRIYGTFITAIVPAMLVWVNYQFRKASNVARSGKGFFDRSIADVVFFVVSAVHVLIACFVALCLIWYGIEDVADCASKPLCSGVTAKSTPVWGAILLMICWGLWVLCSAAQLLLQTFLWANMRGVLATIRPGNYTIAMGSEVGAGEQLTANTDEGDDI